MSSFVAAVLGQPPIRSLVVSYQRGVPKDIQGRFLEYHGTGTETVIDWGLQTRYRLPELRSVQCRRNPMLMKTWLNQDELYLKFQGTRDERFVLHLAIYEGDVSAAIRIADCRPDLVSDEAIDLALSFELLEIVAHLVAKRTAHPELRRRHRPWDMSLAEVVVKRNSIEQLQLLEAYVPSVEWPRRTLSRAMACKFEDLATYIYEHHPTTRWDGALDRAAKHGLLSLVQRIHRDKVACTTEAIDLAAANGHANVVRYLREECDAPWTDKAIRGAQASGHIDIVEYLRQQGDAR
ncbi:hypothetical protein ACHHYP_01885 [Achlya hypogyna]|uniref:Ankyrin repeat protein n=1 Tax=Achlya hypogyna TaxID=1202772 RepID=A0A1V9ZSS9_ACHHY|nr:hypothetical protein ACHHYP_01885 [Achlya hypogyna]